MHDQSEIRREIYRLLLLDPPCSYFRSHWLKTPDDVVTNPEDLNQLVSEEDHAEEVDVYSLRRYPAILRTNRQIYSEASSFLYSELDVHLQPVDVFWLNTGKSIVGPGRRQWSAGAMESHVLARFKKITFETDFTWEKRVMTDVYPRRSRDPTRSRDITRENALDKIAPGLFVGPLVDRGDPTNNHVFFYKRSTFIHQLIQVLSKFSDITRLIMNIDTSFIPYAIPQGEKWQAASEYALEYFLDSGSLTALEKLSNIRSIRFDCDTLERDALDEPYYLKWDRVELLIDLMQRIERNYAARNAQVLDLGSINAS